MENIPNKIYLQIGDADVTIDQDTNDFNDLFRGAITWADERINANDIEYERRQNADLKNAALPIFSVSGSATDFEKDLYKLINAHCKKGLKKPDLVHKMQYVTKSCELS